MGVQLTQEMIKGAQETEKLTGVPASITLAQIIQESSGKYSGGLSGLAYQGKNLFGVKAKSGENYIILKANSTGEPIKWKAYNSYYDSIIDHARILNLDRYKSRYQSANSLSDYAYALQEGGYAGDSKTYANSLLKVIEQNNLSQYDGKTTTDINFKADFLEQENVNIKDRFTNLFLKDYYTDIKNQNNLTWYGDIFRFGLIILCVIVGVFFLLKSLNIDTNVKNKIVSKAIKKVGVNDD